MTDDNETPNPKSSTSGETTLELPLSEEHAEDLKGAIVVGYMGTLKVLNKDGELETHTVRHGLSMLEAYGAASLMVDHMREVYK